MTARRHGGSLPSRASLRSRRTLLQSSIFEGLSQSVSPAVEQHPEVCGAHAERGASFGVIEVFDVDREHGEALERGKFSKGEL